MKRVRHDYGTPAKYGWKKLHTGCYESPCGGFLAMRSQVNPDSINHKGVPYEPKGWNLIQHPMYFLNLCDLKASVKHEVETNGHPGDDSNLDLVVNTGQPCGNCSGPVPRASALTDVDTGERGSLDEASTGRYAVGKDGKLYTDTGGIGNADNVVHHGMGDFGGMLGGIEVYFMRIDNTPTGNALEDAGFVGRPHEVQAGKKSRGTFKAKDVAKVFKKKGAKLVKFDESNESIGKCDKCLGREVTA